jgi:hypothetical protein
MAVVQGVKEKVHLPIYDSLTVEPGKQLRDAESSSTLRFFVNVQGKNKLETNLQSASLLPHYNTFEARAMRVVISDLPPEFSEEAKSKGDEEFAVMQPPATPGGDPEGTDFTASIKVGLKRLMELLREAQESGQDVELEATADGVELTPQPTSGTPLPDGAFIPLSAAELEGLIESLERRAPPKQQINPNNGAGTLIGQLIYNTVTTFYVGEKIMIQMPTWFFPAGAGPYSEAARFTTHGEPSPTATFRFAEPIFIDKQQNFRVEIETPDADVLKEVQKIYGPLFIWVVLDGYMTRDVQ